MYHTKVRIVGAVILLALFMSLSGFFATTVYAAEDPRTVVVPPLSTNADLVANNPNRTSDFECSQVESELDQYGAIYPFTSWPYGTLNQFKFDAEPSTSSRTYTDIDNAPVANPSITLQRTANSLTWSSNFGIDLVLMKGGNKGTNIYVYSPSGTGGSGLTVPTGQGISHVTFCWDNPATIKVDKTTNPDSLDDTPFNFELKIPSYLKGETSTTESFTLSDNGGIETFVDLPQGDYELSEILTPAEDTQNSTSVVCTLARDSSTTTIVNSSEDESIEFDDLRGKDVVTCNFTNEQLSEPELCVEDVTNSVSWMNEFNLITLEDLAGVTHVQGFTYIGGNYTDESMSEFNQSSPYASCSQASVIVFGSILSGTEMRAEHGDVVVGGAKDGTVWFNGGTGCSVVFDKPLSKDAITAAFQNASLKLSQATPNNTAVIEHGNQLNFYVTNVDANGLAVFNIAAGNSFNLGSIAQIEVKGNHSAATTILINVSGSTVNWNNGNMVGMLTSNAGRQKVIWNFYEATTINTNKNFNGALLAPFANVNTSSVNLDGSVVVKKLSNAGEVHRPDFSLVNTEPLTSVCSPATNPAIVIKKYTNGEDADTMTGPIVEVGSTVNWTYIVTNTGDVTLTNVSVSDDKGISVSCPETELSVGETMTCTASGIAVAGQYKNVGTVTGNPPVGEPVSDDDPSHYFGAQPGISIKKYTNGEDADSATGDNVPEINVGGLVTWTYLVENTGNMPFAKADITVSDDQLPVIDQPEYKSGDTNGNQLLDTDETWTYEATGVVLALEFDMAGVTTVEGCYVEGNVPRAVYENTGTVTIANGPTDSDLSHYCNPAGKLIVKKMTTVATDETFGFTIKQDSNSISGTIELGNGEQTEVIEVAPNTEYLVEEIVPDGWTLSDAQCAEVTSFTTYSLPQDPQPVENPLAVSVGAGETWLCTFTNEPEFVAEPRIVIKKYTNSEDADNETGPIVEVGSTVNWTYIVTNTGNVVLTNVTVSDDQGVTVSCPETELSIGETMTCTANGTAIAGQYANIGSVTGNPPVGTPVSDEDPSHYFGADPAIVIKKYTNGEDADTATGPMVEAGSTVEWTYIVTNTGNVVLTDVTVTDDQNVTVSCPDNELSVGETMTCTASGIAVAGQYKNVGSVTGTPPTGTPVSDDDPSHYFGADPAIVIKKYTNGEDADTATGPVVEVGSIVNWTYIVTNTGNVTLASVTVSDDQGVTVSCPKSELVAGETMTCTASGVAVAGQYKNIGTVIGTPPVGTPVSDDDPSHYFGLIPQPAPASLGDRVWHDLNANGVQDGGEPGIGNVTVTLFNGNGAQVGAPATTNGDGLYAFTSLTPGSYYVVFGLNTLPSSYVVTAQNVGDDLFDSDGAADTGRTQTVTLAAGENNLSLDLGVYQPASLGDRVWVDSNENGQQDGGEANVPGVTVTLFNSSNVQVGQPTTTDGNGLYAFTNLLPGSYYVVFSLPAKSSFTAANQGGVSEALDSDADATGKTPVATLTSGQNYLDLDAGIVVEPEVEELLSALGNKVWFDLNKNGIQDENEAGVAGVKVDLYTGEGSFVATTTTDANGEYLFAGLKAGSYYVEFANVEGYSFTHYNVTGNSQDAADNDPVVPVVEVGVSDGGVEGLFGQPLVYTFFYTNTDATLAASNVVLSTTVPVGTSFTPDGSGWDCAGGGSNVAAGTVCTFTIPTVAANSSGSVTFVVTLGLTDAEVPDALDLQVSLTQSTVARTEVVTLGAGETNLTVDAGLVHIEASLLTATPTAPTNLPGTGQPQTQRALFLPTVQSGD